MAIYYTIYKTTNILNGMYYIGQHQTKNIDDGYLGSGTRLNNAIKKYGRQNFKKEILHILETEQEMNLKEVEIVTEELISDSLCYNLISGGTATNKSYKEIGAIGNGKMIWLRENNKEWVENLSFSHIRSWENNREVRLNNFMKKQHLGCIAANTPEVKQKRKETYKKIKFQQGANNSQYGLKVRYVTNTICNKRISLDQPIPEGFWIGRTTIKN